MSKIGPKFLAISALIAFSYGSYADESCETSNIISPSDASSCCNRARARAIEINSEIDDIFPISNPAGNPTLAADLFASKFAPGGIFQAVGAPPSIGPAAIRQLWLNYSNNVFGDNDSDQQVINRQIYWDQAKATLVVERTWISTLTGARNFCGTILPAGATYAQDDAVVIRFACDPDCENGCILPGLVVYYHEYFDTCQTVSAYTDAYTRPCDCVGEECSLGGISHDEPVSLEVH